MITRVWHGKTNTEQADQYLDFLLYEGTKEYRKTKGNLSAKVWHHRESDCCHFWTVTEWKDIKSIKAFAGEEYEKAKYYPQDSGVLLEFEEKVKHFECHDVSHSKMRGLLNQMEELYAGGNWLAECFLVKLGDVGEDLAFTEPMPGVHSIGEVLWHCIYWRTVLIKRLQGNVNYRDETFMDLNFQPIDKLKAKTWNQLRRDFDESQEQVIGLLRLKNDSFLKEEYKPGCSYNYLLNGIIQHDSYHLGQIGLVKSMIGRKLSS